MVAFKSVLIIELVSTAALDLTTQTNWVSLTERNTLPSRANDPLLKSVELGLDRVEQRQANNRGAPRTAKLGQIALDGRTKIRHGLLIMTRVG